MSYSTFAICIYIHIRSTLHYCWSIHINRLLFPSFIFQLPSASCLRLRKIEFYFTHSFKWMHKNTHSVWPKMKTSVDTYVGITFTSCISVWYTSRFIRFRMNVYVYSYKIHYWTKVLYHCKSFSCSIHVPMRWIYRPNWMCEYSSALTFLYFVQFCVYDFCVVYFPFDDIFERNSASFNVSRLENKDYV